MSRNTQSSKAAAQESSRPSRERRPTVRQKEIDDELRASKARAEKRAYTAALRDRQAQEEGMGFTSLSNRDAVTSGPAKSSRRRSLSVESEDDDDDDDDTRSAPRGDMASFETRAVDFSAPSRAAVRNGEIVARRPSTHSSRTSSMSIPSRPSQRFEDSDHDQRPVPRRASQLFDDDEPLENDYERPRRLRHGSSPVRAPPTSSPVPSSPPSRASSPTGLSEEQGRNPGRSSQSKAKSKRKATSEEEDGQGRSTTTITMKRVKMTTVAPTILPPSGQGDPRGRNC
ncbi:hypothetical protein NMY22_g16130 [Coprinellus aureogranulatus]|nr:hypothetical protein NMY22_g16130 [Coprinellus aureogranulatus]